MPNELILSLFIFHSIKNCLNIIYIFLHHKGGSLGVADVKFSVRNGTAFLGEDFTISSGTVQFSNGQNSSSINIPIIDDDVPEQRDTFTVTLDSVTGGAKLGSPTTVAVTIETSDDPGGLFGFVNASQLSLQNPSISTDISFVIEREGGAEGTVEVSSKYEFSFLISLSLLRN